MSAASAPWLRWTWRIAAIAIAVWTCVAVRTAIDAQRALARGERAERGDDLDAAIDHYRDAAHAWTPWLPMHAQALDALERVAVRLEAVGDLDRALVAHRAALGAIWATRWPGPRERERLDRLERHVQRLSPAPEHHDRAHRVRRTRSPTTAPWASALMLGGAVAWLGGTWWAIRTRFDEHDRWTLRGRDPIVATVVVGFGAFVAGLLFA